MLELVKQRLNEFGLTEINVDLIDNCINRVEDYIKVYCNREEIPKGIDNIEMDMVCAEYISTLNMTGQLDDFISPIKSITEGDVSVTMTSGSNGIDGFINYLNKGKDNLICYRRIRW